MRLLYSDNNSDGESWDAVILSLLLAVLLIAYMSVYWLSNSTRWWWIPSSSLYIFFGCCAFGVLLATSPNFNPQFNSEFFFFALLPPVIFNSGLEINIPLFLSNFDTIMVFANLGTFINAVVVGVVLYALGLIGISPYMTLAQQLAFGSLVSATDPVTTIAVFDRFHVDAQLYTIVVGVSVLDDAIAVILFDICTDFVEGVPITFFTLLRSMALFAVKLFGSMIVGYFMGIIMTHFVHSKALQSDATLRSIASIFSVYFIYILSDALYLSGIIAAMLAGISFQRTCKEHIRINNNSNNNNSKEREHDISSIFNSVRTLINRWSSLFESLVFIYIGSTLFFSRFHNANDVVFTIWSIIACLIGRFAQIYPLSLLMNAIHSNHHQQHNQQHQLIADDSTHTTLTAAKTTTIAIEEEDQEREVAVQQQRGSVRGSDLGREQGGALLLTVGSQHMLMLAGLRGPIAFATAQLFPCIDSNNSTNNNTDLCNAVAVSTSSVVVLTSTLFGALTKPALTAFDIQCDDNTSNNVNDNNQQQSIAMTVDMFRVTERLTHYTLRCLRLATTSHYNKHVDSNNNNSDYQEQTHNAIVHKIATSFTIVDDNDELEDLEMVTL